MVEPDQEVTFSYPFKIPDDVMEPMDLQMAMTVFYSDRDEEFSSTFYNETVSFVVADTGFDWAFLVQLIRDIVVAGTILGGLSYALFGPSSVKPMLGVIGFDDSTAAGAADASASATAAAAAAAGGGAGSKAERSASAPKGGKKGGK